MNIVSFISFRYQMEQLAQKEEKRSRTRTYSIRKAATGSWCPLWSQGIIVGLNVPYTDEPRIRLNVGDTVKVTRWKKYSSIHCCNEQNRKQWGKKLIGSLSITLSLNRHWLFGEKASEAKKKGKKNGISENDATKTKRIRGWFPRCCAVELVNPESDDEQNHFTAKKTS